MKIIDVLSVLKKLGLAKKDNNDLYNALKNNTNSDKNVITCIELASRVGFDKVNDKNFFLKACEHADQIANTISDLQLFNSNFEDNKELFKNLIKHPEHLDQVPNIINLAQEQRIDLSKDKAIYIVESCPHRALNNKRTIKECYVTQFN